jgi:hypothetical protein
MKILEACPHIIFEPEILDLEDCDERDIEATIISIMRGESEEKILSIITGDHRYEKWIALPLKDYEKLAKKNPDDRIYSIDFKKPKDGDGFYRILQELEKEVM